MLWVILLLELIEILVEKETIFWKNLKGEMILKKKNVQIKIVQVRADKKEGGLLYG